MPHSPYAGSFCYDALRRTLLPRLLGRSAQPCDGVLARAVEASASSCSAECTMSLMAPLYLAGDFALPFWFFLRQAPFVLAFGLTSAFALTAWGLRAVSASGAIAGFVLTLIISLAVGPPGFVAVLVLFLLTLLATRFGYAQKKRQGRAERHGGRTGAQVLANLGAATMVVVPLLVTRRLSYVLLAGFTAALAEAAADTVSSEVGQVLSPRRAYLITNFERIDTGTDGGISFAGCMAGLIASGIVCVACEKFYLLLTRWFWLAVVIGVAGMLLDSVLGAKLERPGRLGNNSVNFISTAFAAFVMILIVFLFR